MTSFSIRDFSIGIALGAGVLAIARSFSSNSILKNSSDHSTDVVSLREPNLRDSEELRDEQFSRNRRFFGDEASAKVESSFVIVVGAGGVGSHAAHMLCRSGVGRLRLIDFDMVTLSSLNRHATAGRADVGISKVDALKRSFARITPSCIVETMQSMLKESNVEDLLLGASPLDNVKRIPDFVLDCIDDKETKTALLIFCKQRGLRVLSSLGAGGKADPTRVSIGDLSYVRHDPLGISIRQNLRKLHVLPKGTQDGREILRVRKTNAASSSEVSKTNAVSSFEVNSSEVNSSSDDINETLKEEQIDESAFLSGIPCVYSTEIAQVKLLPLTLGPGETPQDFGANNGFRIRVMPVVGTMPAIFGQAMCAYVLCSLGSYPIEPVESAKLQHSAVFKMQNSAAHFDRKHYAFSGPGWSNIVGGITIEEAEWVMSELWRQRSPVSGVRASTRGITMVICRWRPWAGSKVTNTLLVEKSEAQTFRDATVSKHMLQCIEDAGKNIPGADSLLESAFRDAAIGVFGKETFEKIEIRLQWAKSCGWE
jgi:tRNA A37 threonylcarbamoyladenosine dehydratase